MGGVERGHEDDHRQVPRCLRATRGRAGGDRPGRRRPLGHRPRRPPRPPRTLRPASWEHRRPPPGPARTPAAGSGTGTPTAGAGTISLGPTAALAHEPPTPLRRHTPGIHLASLDYAMWLHRPFRIDEWLLFALRGPTASGGRGLRVGGSWTRDGVLVASTVQEAVVRQRIRH
ncbi:hypothetical protein ACWF94_05940 [Streptomyces sp. NPDC055078]